MEELDGDEAAELEERLELGVEGELEECDEDQWLDEEELGGD